MCLCTHTHTHTHTHNPLTQRYIGKVFEDEDCAATEKAPAFEGGKFIVLNLASNNNFVCGRVHDGDGDETPRTEIFDMSYAIGKIREYEEE